MCTLHEGHPTILCVRDLETGYGNRRVLSAVNVSVRAGELLALIGHNGAGKSTLLKAMFGLVSPWDGSIAYDQTPTVPLRPVELLRRGIAYLPQGGRVFNDLTVLENLHIGCSILRGRRARDTAIGRALAAFPEVRELLGKRAGACSGGEKQAVALANVFVLSPRVLLLDEPSLGLAPQLARVVFERIQAFSRESGGTIVLAEQKVKEVLGFCDRVCCLKLGRVSYLDAPDALRNDGNKLREIFL